MEPRLDYRKAAPPGALDGMLALEKFVHHCGLEPLLIELVKVRASQINGCGYCLDMHTKDARALGETEQRLYVVSAWREAPFYSPRERAALEWTEALTLLPQHEIGDELYARMREQFTEPELVSLTMAIVAINGWNRLAVPFRSVPGSYVRPAQAAAPRA
jgi:AhpD family alkylhydroperoxidase